MTHPEVPFEKRFSEAAEEAKRILDAPVSSIQFLGTIFVKTEDIHYFAGENLDDNSF